MPRLLWRQVRRPQAMPKQATQLAELVEVFELADYRHMHRTLKAPRVSRNLPKDRTVKEPFLF